MRRRYALRNLRRALAGWRAQAARATGARRVVAARVGAARGRSRLTSAFLAWRGVKLARDAKKRRLATAAGRFRAAHYRAAREAMARWRGVSAASRIARDAALRAAPDGGASFFAELLRVKTRRAFSRGDVAAAGGVAAVGGWLASWMTNSAELAAARNATRELKRTRRDLEEAKRGRRDAERDRDGVSAALARAPGARGGGGGGGGPPRDHGRGRVLGVPPRLRSAEVRGEGSTRGRRGGARGGAGRRRARARGRREPRGGARQGARVESERHQVLRLRLRGGGRFRPPNERVLHSRRVDRRRAPGVRRRLLLHRRVGGGAVHRPRGPERRGFGSFVGFVRCARFVFGFRFGLAARVGRRARGRTARKRTRPSGRITRPSGARRWRRSRPSWTRRARRSARPWSG